MSDGNDEPGRHRLAEPDPESLFRRLNGTATFPLFCHKLYNSILGPADPATGQTIPSFADPILWPFFAVFLNKHGDGRTNLERKLTQILILATKGELTEAMVERLRAKHATITDQYGNPITAPVYDRLLGHVDNVLLELKVEDRERDDVCALLRSIEPAFVQ